MIAKHKKTGVQYRVLGRAFDVQRQRQSVVYIGLNNGVMFTNDEQIFEHTFEMLHNPQANVEPKPPKPPLEDQLELFGSLCPRCGEEDCLGGCANG